MTEKHSPLPWIFDEVRTSCGRCFRIGNKEQVETAKADHRPGLPSYACLYDDFPGHPDNEAKANAALIVQAVNSYASSLQEIAEKDALITELAAARKMHVDAVNAYNDKLRRVKAERAAGDWSSRMDQQYKAMSDAQSAFIKAAQDIADSALARAALSYAEANANG